MKNIKNKIKKLKINTKIIKNNYKNNFFCKKIIYFEIKKSIYLKNKNKFSNSLIDFL